MRIKVLLSIFVCLCLGFGIIYFKQDDKKEKKEVVNTNYQTVVFRDDDNMLVPIEIDLKQDLEDDSKYRNLIEVMKSKDYEYLGLHPILDANLQVNAIAINDKSLTFDFSDHLYVENNQEYYVPITKRIETQDNDIDTKVSLMLKEIESEQPLTLVQQCSLNEGHLNIYLASNILNDNESIDNNLYNQIVKSASHLENVKKVSLYIDGQEITPVEDVNGKVDNRIKI